MAAEKRTVMEHLIEKRNQIAAQMNSLAALENRTEAQTAELDAVGAQFDEITAEIERAEAVQARNAKLSAPRNSFVKPSLAPKMAPVMDLNTFVKNVAMNPESIRNATTYGNETTGADGGFLAPTEYSKALDVLLAGPQSIMGLCDSLSIGTNSTVLPIDEDPYWSAAGIQAEDVNEGGTYTERKPVFKQLTITLGKTGVLVPVSEELLSDGVNVGGYIAEKSAQKLMYKLNAKAMTAFLASGAKITVAKTVGAAAGSAPDIDNVLALFESVPAELRDGAVWFINPRLQKSLMKLVLGQVPVFVPGNSLANAPHDMLLGHRVIWSNLCAAQGTAGDIVFVAPKSFYCVTRGTKSSVSEHLYFDVDQVAFKSSVRFACKSKFSAVITAPDSTTYGNVAVLATRA